MDFLMESGFMHWMSERMPFTNWVKADFHETSRITLEAIAKPAAASAVSSKPPYLFRENRCNSGRAASTMPPL